MGDKAVRKLAAATGLPLVKVVVWSDPVYAEGVDAQDRHYAIDRKANTFEPIENPHHFSTCPLGSADVPPNTLDPTDPRYRFVEELRAQDRRIADGVSNP